MKKKVLIISVACALIAAIGFVAFWFILGKNDGTTVTEEEWNAAFRDKDLYSNCTSEDESTFFGETTKAVYRHDRPVTHIISYQADGSVTETYYDDNYRYEVSGDEVKKYDKYDGNFVVITENENSEPYPYEKFTYDEASCSYKSDKFVMTYDFADTENDMSYHQVTTYTNVEVSFLDGRITSLSYSASQVIYSENAEPVESFYKCSATFGSTEPIVIPDEWKALEVSQYPLFPSLPGPDYSHSCITLPDGQVVSFDWNTTEIELPNGTKVPYTPGSNSVELPDGTVLSVLHLHIIPSSQEIIP